MTDTVSVSGLSVRAGDRVLVEPLDARIEGAHCLGLIGESGSGKSLTARALVGLLPPGIVASGQVDFGGNRIDLSLPDRDAAWGEVRGRRAVLLLQDPFTSLSPVHRCGEQIAWSFAARDRAVSDSSTRLGRRSHRRYAAEVAALLAELNLDEAVAQSFPHELSGGQRQRVAIASAMATRPDLLIADEPTTALDASNQGEVLDLLRGLQRQRGMAMILISHDLGLIRGRADEVVVMRAGHVIERGETSSVLSSPRAEYTQALIAANPSIESLGHVHPDDAIASTSTAAHKATSLLEVRGVTKAFGGHTAVEAVSLEVGAGEILAVVGESGSGKSTLARCITGLEMPDAGEILLNGVPLPAGRRGRTPGQMQIVFQDPYSTLNPIFSVRQTLAEALRASGRHGADSEVDELLARVGLDASLAARRPSQLSGGQRQRVSIARALAPDPRLLICDESVSALDVLVQADILDMLAALRSSLGLTILFITHDLGVVSRLADRVAVMSGGALVETGPTVQVLNAPKHPYTMRLSAAARSNSLLANQGEAGGSHDGV